MTLLSCPGELAVSGLSPSSGHVYLDREPVATLAIWQRQERGTQDRHILRAVKNPGVLEVLNTEHLGKSSKETVKISWPFCTVFWATPGSENIWKNMPQDTSGHPGWLLRGPSLPTVLLAAPAGSHLLLGFWYLVPQNISVWDMASFVMFRTTAPFLKLISSPIFSWE